jgi:hypothetical protein
MYNNFPRNNFCAFTIWHETASYQAPSETLSYISASGIKGRSLALRSFLHLSVELAGGGLVESHLLIYAKNTNRLQEPQGAKDVGFADILRRFEGYLHVALGPQIVDLVVLHLLDDTNKVGAVGKTPIMEKERTPSW